MGPRRKGFTLVEAVLALALAAFFATGAVAAVGRIARGFHLRAAAWSVTSGLNQARFQAILTGTRIRLRVAAPGFLLERYDETAGAWRLARSAALDGVIVRANNAPVFHPQGTVSDLVSITISNARGSYRITVAITGRVRTVRTGRAQLRRLWRGRAGGRRAGSSSGSRPWSCWCAGTRRPSRRRWPSRRAGTT
jgi:Tfp pilus assembly protein FimT